MDSSEYGGRDLKDYLGVLKSRRWVFLFVLVAVTAAAVFLSQRQTPMYRAEARVLVKSLPSSATEVAPPPPNLVTEKEVVSSEPVALRVQKELNTDESLAKLLRGLDVKPVADGDVMVVSFVSDDPKFAQDAANAFASGYIEHRRSTATATLEAAQASIEKRIASVEQQLSETLDQVRELRGGDPELETALFTERSALVARLGVLQQRFDDLQPDRSIQLGAGEVIETAHRPSSAFSPNHITNGILGGVAGILLALGLVFLLDRMDDNLRRKEDVERALEAPLIGSVPNYKTKRKAASKIVTLEDPHGGASEAYKNLSVGIQFVAEQTHAKTFLVTSAFEGEGKTITTANLGVVLAQIGLRVVVVGGDLRKPKLSEYFGLQNNDGLSNWLTQTDRDAATILRTPAAFDRLRIIPSGTVPANPAGLLNAGRFDQLLQYLKSQFDIILIDSPPLLGVADASLLANRSDAVIFVLRAGETSRAAAVHARESLNRIGVAFAGCILNGYKASTMPYEYATYHYEAVEGVEDRPRKIASSSGGGVSQKRSLFRRN